ncbi:MAG: hypothetical protein H6Q73_1652 [Firmicutes bacterium]|nr:hypothetical protein [Bacillota bacterium]
MLRLATNYLKPGMIIARNIYNANGTKLLAADTALDRRLILKIKKLGIDSVYIRHPFLDIEPQEILHEKTRVEAIREIQKTFELFRLKKVVDLSTISEVVVKIIEDSMDNRNFLIHLSDIRIHDDYTFGHSINVCLLSVMLGIKLNFREGQLFELAMGAILHDLGKMMIPQEILNKPGSLTPEEWTEMRQHTDKGFDILRRDYSMPLVSAHVAYQHHESYDGAGYARGLRGEEIHLFARIVAIADLYDAITADRPYREAMLPHEAYEIMLGSRGTKLDPEFTDVFLESVAIYPVGSTVLLDTGEIAIVVNTFPKLQSRPTVRVVIDERGKVMEGEGKIIDLAVNLTRFITKVFKAEEVLEVAKQN